MLGFLVLHIAALLFWCAAQLYLPALIAAGHGRPAPLAPPHGHGSMARYLFTHFSTPAALVAIVAGTVVFLLERNTPGWLVVKLTLVSLLCITHVLTGLLLLRAHFHPEKPVLIWCWVLGGVLSALMLAIVWVVLAKPGTGLFS